MIHMYNIIICQHVLVIFPVILSPAMLILSLSLPVFGSPNKPCSQVFITVRTGNGHYVRHVVLYGDPPTLPSSVRGYMYVSAYYLSSASPRV